MVNCLFVGHGARDHAIAEALVKGGAELYAFMSFNNAGLEDLIKGRIKIHSDTDFKEMFESDPNGSPWRYVHRPGIYAYPGELKRACKINE